MADLLTRSWGVWILAASIGTAAVAEAPGRSVREILGELQATRMPAYDAARASVPGYNQSVQKQAIEVGARRDALILELLRVDPDHDALPELMAEHWRRTPPTGPNEPTIAREIADVLARSRNEKVRAEAHFARAQVDLYKGRHSGKLELAGVEEFVRRYPKDQRAEQLLYMASVVARDAATRRSLETRVLEEYPRSRVAEAILGARRQCAALGKPFPLEFVDAISGSTVSVKKLEGKVVVIDFWATWSVPSVAQIPYMKQLHARYHRLGLEMIGVSLDLPVERGGLESLKRFVKEHGLAWPQFYQGQFWDGEFSRSWGINALPTVFVIDAGGNLVAILGRENLREQLDQVVSGLLRNRAGAPATPANRR